MSCESSVIINHRLRGIITEEPRDMLYFQCSTAKLACFNIQKSPPIASAVSPHAKPAFYKISLLRGIELGCFTRKMCGMSIQNSFPSMSQNQCDSSPLGWRPYLHFLSRIFFFYIIQELSQSYLLLINKCQAFLCHMQLAFQNRTCSTAVGIKPIAFSTL